MVEAEILDRDAPKNSSSRHFYFYFEKNFKKSLFLERYSLDLGNSKISFQKEEIKREKTSFQKH